MIGICKKCMEKQDVDISNIKGKVVRYKCEKCRTDNILVVPALVQKEELQKKKIKIDGLSIKTKITLIIVALVLLSVSAVGYIASNRGSKALADQAQDHLKLITHQKALEYNSVFSRLQDEIEGVAVFAKQTYSRSNINEDLDLFVLLPWNGTTYGSAQEKSKFTFDIRALQRIGISMQGLVKSSPYILAGYMGAANNLMVMNDEADTKAISQRDGFVPSKRSWFQDAVKARKTIWTQPYVDVVTDKLVVTCATPVYDDAKKLIGIVGFDVLLDTIIKDIISLNIGYDSKAFLVGNDGSLLAKPDMGKVNTKWNEAVKTDNLLESSSAELKKIVSRMIDGESGIGHLTENGENSLVSFSPLPAIGASVGITVSEKAVMKPAADIQNLIITVWAIVVVITVIVGYSVGNGITKPINEIINKANLISQGKTNLDLMKTTRKDEIGVLIDSFNRLISSLKIAMSFDDK